MGVVFKIWNLAVISPELCVLAAAFLALAVDMIYPQKGRKNLVFLVGLAGLGLALTATAMTWGWKDPGVFGLLLASDTLSSSIKLILLIIALLCLLITRQTGPEAGLERAEYTSLLLFATFGMMILAGASHFLAVFVALETFSLAMYVLAGFNPRLAGNREAALKYFLPGAFAAGFFLFGSALIFGATAHLDYQAFSRLCHDPAVAPGQRVMMLAGFLMVLAAFAFKIGLVPFHFWVPDTYEGAPTPVTAFLSAGAKAAGLAAILRLTFLYLPAPVFLNALNLGFDGVGQVLAVLAVLTMTLANLTALRQNSLKRMLAYSSVAHSGYALIGVVAGTPEAASAVLMYVAVYALLNFCAFGLLAALEKGAPQGQTVVMGDLAGLGFTRPIFGAALAVAMFGLAGLPPTAGFVAKFNVFRAAVDSGHIPLVIIAVLNSLVSVGYYLRVLIPLYMKPQNDKTVQPSLGGIAAWAILACALAVLFLGVLPNPLVAVFRQ